MSHEIVVPRKSFGGVLAISEFAEVFVFLFLGAVAGGYVAFNISSPIELPVACLNRTGKVSAMCLDMFANRRSIRAVKVGSVNAKIGIRTGAHSSARTSCGTLHKISHLEWSL